MNNFYLFILISLFYSDSFSQNCIVVNEIPTYYYDKYNFNDNEGEIIKNSLKKDSVLLLTHIDSLNKIKDVNYKCINKGKAIKYLPKSNIVLIPKNYIINRFFEVVGEHPPSLFFLGSKDNYTRYVTEKSIKVYYTILYDLAHENVHAQINQFVKNYKDGSKDERLKFFKLIKDKEEILSDFLTGVYFRQIKLIESFNEYKPNETYLAYLIEYTFSLGDIKMSSNHPMKHQRLSAFVLGAFSETNFKLPLTDNLYGFLGFVGIMHIIIDSKELADRGINSPFENDLPIAQRKKNQMERQLTVPYWSFQSFEYDDYKLSADYIFDIKEYKNGIKKGVYTKEEVENLIPEIFDYKEFAVKKALKMYEEFNDILEIKIVVRYEGAYEFKTKREEIQSILDNHKAFFLEKSIINSLFLKYGNRIND